MPVCSHCRTTWPREALSEGDLATIEKGTPWHCPDCRERAARRASPPDELPAESEPPTGRRRR